MVRFSISTERYHGPLETLLDLIEDRKFLVSDISLAQVCDAYLAYVESLPTLPMSETAQFVAVAATLLLIKSRSLLPDLTLTEEETANIHDLQARLAVYGQVRAATKVLRAQWNVHRYQGAYKVPIRISVFAPGSISIAHVHGALVRALNAIPIPEQLVERTIAPVIALEDVIKDVRVRIRSALRTRFSDLTRSAHDRHEVIVYFLAVLELVRGGSASVAQETLFSDITIEAAGDYYGVPKYI